MKIIAKAMTRHFPRIQALTSLDTRQHRTIRVSSVLSVLRTGSESMRQKERIYTNALKLSQG